MVGMRVMFLPSGLEHQCAAKLAKHPLAQELMDPKHFAGEILTVLCDPSAGVGVAKILLSDSIS